jgi:hypothetical protein
MARFAREKCVSLRRLNGVWQYATGTGTGALTLGNAVAAKWRRLQDTVMADGDKFRARIQHSDIPAQWEVVMATYDVAGTISRTLDALSDSATGSLIDFSSGNKEIIGVAIGGAEEPWRGNTAGATTVLADTDPENVHLSLTQAHDLMLPPSALHGRRVRVADILGNVGTYNATIRGSGGATINGQTTRVMRDDWQSLTFEGTGSGWVVCR